MIIIYDNRIIYRIKLLSKRYNDIMKMIFDRTTAETPMNPQSSRSHCIFTIVVSTKQFGAEQYKRAKVHLVDLAGYIFLNLVIDR